MDYLTEGNELDENTRLLISKMEKEIELKDNEIQSKDKEINDLKNQLAFFKNQILNKNRKIFGQSTEQLDSNQISLFDEAEKYNDPKATEPALEEILYTRKKPDKNIGKKDNLANLEKVVIEHKLEESEAICDKCSGSLKVIGTKSKEVLKYIPAKLYIEEHITYSYACDKCETERGEATIITTKAPKTALYKSMASNELLAHVITLKYLHAMPLYRQESYFKMLGANLSRQTLSNWIISAAGEFEVIYELMKEELLKADYVQADETTLRVIEDNGKDSNSKKYMWLYKTGASKTTIILYNYQKTRSSSCPKEFLKGFSGILQTDGYVGYNKVEAVTRLYCLAHIRRKFHEIIINLDEEALKKSRAVIGFNFCEKLYAIEKAIRDQYGENEDFYKMRLEIRNEKSSPILQQFQEYVNKEIVDALPKSPLGLALAYTKNLLPSMTIIMENGALEIDNNASERSIKPFVIGRKNWLFSTSSKGAKASASLYSIIETAKANGLMVEKYLTYLLDVLSNTETKSQELLAKVMPCSKDLPEELKIPSKK